MNARIIRIIRSFLTVRTASRIRTTTSNLSNRPRGFTLIEILIVLGIIGMVLGIGIPAIERVTTVRLRSTTRKFIGLVRTIRDDSVLLSSIYRLAINMEDQTYWVEVQKEFKLLDQEVTPPETKESETAQAGAQSYNFDFAQKYSKQPIKMPDGVVFDGLFKDRGGMAKTGINYIHFFPNGITERAILYLNRENSKASGFSLVIRPTTGKVDLFAERIENFDSVPIQ